MLISLSNNKILVNKTIGGLEKLLGPLVSLYINFSIAKNKSVLSGQSVMIRIQKDVKKFGSFLYRRIDG